MKYRVWNPERDMKIMIDGEVYIIKRGEKISVSQIDYQHLAQVYGMEVKGEKEYTVRVTVPAEIESVVPASEKVSAKKRRKKR